MIGIIHKTIEDTLIAAGGPELRAKVLEAAQLAPSTIYRIDENHSDDDVHALIAATCQVTGLSVDEVYDAFAEQFLLRAQKMFPKFFEMCGSAKEFVTLQPKIHNTIGSGLRSKDEREAVRKKFSVAEESEDALLIEYNSPNRLCHLYVILAKRFAAHYGDIPVCNFEKCAKRGDTTCAIRLNWAETAENGGAGRVS